MNERLGLRVPRGARWLGLAAAGILATNCVVACRDEDSTEAPAEGSGGAGGTASADAGTGNVPTLTLVDRTTSGVAQSAGTGTSSAAAGGATTTAGSTSTTGLISEEEWAKLTAPVEGGHEVETRGCDATPIDQAYKVQPRVVCYLADDYNYLTNPVRNCQLEPYCVWHSDCTEGRFGRCQGVPTTICQYGLEREPCSDDSDCTSLPNGSCYTFAPADINCYPTGRCEPGGPYCYYPVGTCAEDADCDAAPGGSCAKLVQFTSCTYPECEEDADCPTARRCLCSSFAERNLCVDSDCTDDSDCADGEACLAEYACYGAAAGYHCTTPEDTCQTAEECPNYVCEFADGHRSCATEQCPIFE